MRTPLEICEADPEAKAILRAINAGGYAAEKLLTALRVACAPGGIFWNEREDYLNPAIVLGLGDLISRNPVQWRAVHSYLPEVESVKP